MSAAAVVIIDQGHGDGPGGVQRFVSNVPATLFSLFQTARQMGFNLEPLLNKVGIDASAIVAEDPRAGGQGRRTPGRPAGPGLRKAAALGPPGPGAASIPAVPALRWAGR